MHHCGFARRQKSRYLFSMSLIVGRYDYSFIQKKILNI